MIKKLSILSVAMLGLLASPRFAAAEEVPSAPVTIVQSPDTRPCTFFQLKGLNRWYAVNQSSVGYKEAVAMLLMAQASGKSVSVTTTGANDAQCGESAVARVFVQ